MELLSIGAFARATRLSHKALRVYDERGILTPARVDPDSGYRFYRRDQLERARLIAWLRRLGMPLARIAEVCAKDPRDAADDVAAYWRGVQADTAARGDIASLLIEHLSRRDESMTATSITVRTAALADQGKVRESNQDAAYAGEQLLAVADGFGANPGERLASAVALEALASLDVEPGSGELLDALESIVSEAEAAVQAHAGTDRTGSGTTLTALLWSGNRVGLVHIGDCRVYVLHGGHLAQLTHDHTVVQSLVDEGKISQDEVASHPERSTLFKALTGAQESSAQPELRILDCDPGDRFLLCSDGLHTVVEAQAIRECLASSPSPEQAVRALVDLANEAGGPDNVVCAVADIANP